jgi:leucyl aminopeptidase
VAGALVEGTILASYRFDRYRARREDDPPRDLDEVIVSAHHDVADAVHRGAVGADAQNFARELQDTPANDLTPTALAERAARSPASRSRSTGATGWPSRAWARCSPSPRAPTTSRR